MTLDQLRMAIKMELIENGIDSPKLTAMLVQRDRMIQEEKAQSYDPIKADDVQDGDTVWFSSGKTLYVREAVAVDHEGVVFMHLTGDMKDDNVLIKNFTFVAPRDMWVHIV